MNNLNKKALVVAILAALAIPVAANATVSSSNGGSQVEKEKADKEKADKEKADKEKADKEKADKDKKLSSVIGSHESEGDDHENELKVAGLKETTFNKEGKDHEGDDKEGKEGKNFDKEGKGIKIGEKGGKEHEGGEHHAPGTSAVPIPGAVWLFGSALAGLVGFGRKRQK